MKRLIPLILLLGLLPAACMQDPVTPDNEPQAPSVGYDEESLTRNSVILTGALADASGIAEYGFELAETSFSNGDFAVFSNPPKDADNHFSISAELKPGAFYVLRSYVSSGSAKKYSPVITLKAPATAVATVSEVELSDGQLRASILDDGGRPVKEAGFCWGENPYPSVIKRNKIAAVLDASGSFSLNVTELEGGKTYYFLAYAENSADEEEAYGYSDNPYRLDLSDDFPVTIEDAAFSSYLISKFDRDRDGVLSYKEVTAITTINVSTDNIRSLKGIGMMPKLTSLTCAGSSSGSGQLEELDVSQNAELTVLKCGNNRIANLDLSNNPGLKTLAVDGNPLSSIDISRCPALTGFTALNCTQMSTIYVSPEFTRQTHSGFKVESSSAYALAPSAPIPFPDVNLRRYLIENYDRNHDDQISVAESAYVNEIYVISDYVVSLSGIEFLENLSYLTCRGTEQGSGRIETLDISHNPKLEYLDCQKNRLTALDVSHNPQLRQLDCGDNSLTSLDVTHNPALTDITCWSNKLSRLDVSQNPALVYLACSANQLTSLNVSNNRKLQKLYVFVNQLTTMDVGSNPELQEFNCGQNMLSQLDVSNNPELLELSCDRNMLTRLDVSSSPNLTYLNCSVNQLSRLDVSANLSLENLVCYSNPSLVEIWLKTGQTIGYIDYDSSISTINYK